MKFLAIIDIILGAILFYLIFIHGYILARRKFKCMRCGRCCRLRVHLSEEEINKIKKLGYKDFLDNKNRIKRVNGYCIFLTLDKGITSCKLENSAKPNTCKNFPAIRGCFGKEYDYRCRYFWKPFYKADYR